MPGHAGSPYWATVDFDSEGDEEHCLPSQRIYLDPWDNEAYGIIQTQTDSMETTQGENLVSFVGEPVSASFYYVPTKNYDSDEDTPFSKRNRTLEQLLPDYPIYGRKTSRLAPPIYYPEMAIYERPIRDRRMSMYIDEPMYAPHPIMYEPLYGVLPPHPAPGYVPRPPRSRMSLPHHSDYTTGNVNFSRNRKHSRLTDAYEHFAYESLSPEYEDWARPFPKTAPENFHLSRYGHLEIDYSCSWNSLDRLIRNS